MLVTLHPAANTRDVVDVLTGIRGEANSSMGAATADRLTGYLEWAARSARMLHNRLRAADIDQLISTRGYDRLLSSVGNLVIADTGTQRVINGLLDMELQLRIEALDEIITDLNTRNPQWSGDDLYAVLDTSVYIEHGDKLENLDIAPQLTAFPDKRLHLLVPIVVIDELDGIKNKGDGIKRWRAAYTLGVVERIFSPKEPRRGYLRDGEYGVRGAVDMEILFDSPGHIRLPVNDDEIIDRTLAATPLAEKPVTLITFDTGQTLRAREAGVPVIKLTKPLGAEPEPKQKR
jgi:rRNA-processing protein FCF1